MSGPCCLSSLPGPHSSISLALLPHAGHSTQGTWQRMRWQRPCWLAPSPGRTGLLMGALDWRSGLLSVPPKYTIPAPTARLLLMPLGILLPSLFTQRSAMCPSDPSHHPLGEAATSPACWDQFLWAELQQTPPTPLRLSSPPEPTLVWVTLSSC